MQRSLDRTHVYASSLKYDLIPASIKDEQWLSVLSQFYVQIR